MSKKHGPSVKNDKTYEALRDRGYGKAKAASIANAQANDDMSPSERGGKAPAYENWTREDLIERAGELDITGRWDMTKDELITTMRDQS